MNANRLMPDTGESSLLVRKLKIILPLCVLVLTGCCKNYATPEIPMPAADLMTPEPTGSEYLHRVMQNTQSWEATLQDWLTNSEHSKTTSE